MAQPITRRLRMTGTRRRQARPAHTYRVSQCLGGGRTAEVPGNQIAATISAWLAELGADSPLVEEFARAVRTGDWSAARALGEMLSVDVTVAA